MSEAAASSGTASSGNGGLVRQHLIDPEICIRCNTCEEMCPIDAITHDSRNYVIDHSICDGRGDCLGPCPTGAIANWRQVATAFTIEEQLSWDYLPDEEEPEAAADGAAPSMPAGSSEVPEDVARIIAEANKGAGGRQVPPFSAAHPYTGIYSDKTPVIAKVAGNMRLTDDDASSDIHHIVLDFGTQAFPVIEGQSIGVIPPGEDANGRPHHVRLYSVASPRDGERPNKNNVAITVKRVTEDNDGKPVKGVASNYLCDLERGAEVKVTGPYGTTFLMPNHPEANIVMICTGTGSAPMRAMTERRRRMRRHHRIPGRIMLLFGARTQGELPYFGPLQKLPKDLIDPEFAFSREASEEKQYVQDRILKRGDDLAELLKDENTFIFICGHKRMEDGVTESLREVCSGHGLDWDEMLPELRRSGRYHVETYY